MELMVAGGNDGIQVIENYFIDWNTLAVKTDGVCMECGSAEGFFNPSLTLESYYGWRYYAFEPDPAMYQTLCRNRPNDTAVKINSALSNFVGTSKFYVSAHNGNSSLRHSEKHLEELKTYKESFGGSPVREIEVKVIDWPTFLSTYNVTSIDLMTLDVEGHELEVFQSMAQTSVWPKVIQVEFNWSDPSFKSRDEATKQDFSGFYAVAKQLNDMGYLFDYVSMNNAHFSLKTFWEGKERPDEWVEEANEYVWGGYTCYDKTICKPNVIS